MAPGSTTQAPSAIKSENGVALRWWRRVKGVMGREDWRRVAHSAKVGLALTLVSLSVLLDDVFDKLGQNAIWAILTVVVIFEYTAGATLSKGLNRGLGTILAALLGLFVDYMANLMGAELEPFVVGSSLFIIGMMATYTRFLPTIKAKYDYGVVMFLVTFCIVVVSGYKVSDNMRVVSDRVSTIALGVIICFLVCIFIVPIWAGDDLYNVIIQNFEGLANSLEGCLKEYFEGDQKESSLSSKICKGQPFDDKIYEGYKGVLISKQTEESLANFASWEARRGYFGCMYPWKHLVEVGAILRHCAYAVSALHGCVLSEIQAPKSLRKVFATPCVRIGEEVSEVLRQVAFDLKTKKKTKSKQMLLYKVQLTIKVLNDVVYTYPHFIYASHLQNPNPVSNDSMSNPNSNSDTNDVSSLQELSGTSNTPSPPVSCHLESPSCVSPRTSISQTHEISPYRDPSLKQVYDSHVISIPNFRFDNSEIVLSSNSCNNNIEIPNSNQTCTTCTSRILKPQSNSNFQGDKESTTPHSLPSSPTRNVEGGNKFHFKLHKSMEFAESLSLASLITLLIDIVARVEHLLDVVTEFQGKAGFNKEENSNDTPCVDKKVETYN